MRCSENKFPYYCRPELAVWKRATLIAGTDGSKASKHGKGAAQSTPSSPSKAKRSAPEADAAANTGTAPPNSTFGQYLWAELNPNTAAPPSAVRHGLVERLRV